jgi:rsbT antagonist protein RsbS
MMTEEEVSIVKVRNVLLVTIPSSPSDRSIDNLQDSILTKMKDVNPEGVILDISLVNIVDSFFARTIEETSEMISLMGGRTVIAGMQPAVAVTAMELGLNFGNVETALNVEKALDVLSGPGAEKSSDQRQEVR